MFRKALSAALVLLAALTVTGCAVHSEKSGGVSGKDFIYEKGGFPNEFGIRLYEDNKFTYYAGCFSSYVGYGNWELDGDVLTLTEYPDPNGRSKVFRFNVEEDALGYIAEGSDSFMYVKVSDGERFKAGKLEGFPY